MMLEIVLAALRLLTRLVEASAATSRLLSQRRDERRKHEEEGGSARDRPRHLKK